MSLTGHYIDDEWNLTTRCLKTEYYPESHTAVNVLEFLKAGLQEYGMRLGNVAAVTTDNAANMCAAVRLTGELKWKPLFNDNRNSPFSDIYSIPSRQKHLLELIL